MNDEVSTICNNKEWIGVLIAMHNYNDASAKHHDESGRRTASVFILIYFFLMGVIVTDGLGGLSLVVAVFLAIFAKVGYNLVRAHADAAGMHYWRNQRIRDELDGTKPSNCVALSQIFKDSRANFTTAYTGPYYGYSRWHVNWARIHQLFMAVGVIAMLFASINQVACFSRGGCLWVNSNGSTEKFVGPAKEFMKRIYPSSR